jgi:hypothetical protein
MILSRLKEVKLKVEKWLIVVFITALFSFGMQMVTGYWQDPEAIISSDVVDYQSYLPALIIYRDLSLKFLANSKEDLKNRVRGYRLSNGNYVIKTSLGMALLYAPFYLIGHIYATFSHFPTNGYSAPYSLFLTIGSFCYYLTGLLVLGKVLRNYFTDNSTATALFLLTFGTNIVYYLVREPAMSHVYSFFLFSLFIYFSILWHENPSLRLSVLLGLTLGVISLVRPTNSIIVIVFLLWNVASVKGINNKIRCFVKNYKYLIVIGCCSLVVWLPQILYWKMVSGNFLFYSYIDEGFHFANPEILEVLFGFRKGWYVYTPIMIITTIGFYFLYKLQKNLFVPLIVFFIINIYVISSWWCWWYGGSYGHRAFIESYALMVFPLTALIQSTLSSNIFTRFIFISILILLLFHNIFQIIKTKNGALSFDSMTKEAYFETLFKLQPTAKYHRLLEPPPFEEAKNR